MQLVLPRAVSQSQLDLDRPERRDRARQERHLAAGLPGGREVIRAVVALAALIAPGLAAAADQGEALFLARCGYCHLQNGPGTMTLGRRLGPDHALLASRTDLDAATVTQVVRGGLGNMPPLTRVEVPDPELAQIAAYLARNRKP